MWLVYNSTESLTFATTANLTVSGVIADYSSGLANLPVYKTGPGTLTLAGANTYSGTTTVSSGLVINAAYSTASGTSALSIRPPANWSSKAGPPSTSTAAPPPAQAISTTA